MKTKIERLKVLLKGRQEEYKIFGMTSEDAEQDNKIKLEIKELENNLSTP